MKNGDRLRVVKNELWIVEFNPNTDENPIHLETLDSRLGKNVTQLLQDGKVMNSNWVTIGVQYGLEAADEYAQEFIKLWNEAQGNRGEVEK